MDVTGSKSKVSHGWIFFIKNGVINTAYCRNSRRFEPKPNDPWRNYSKHLFDTELRQRAEEFYQEAVPMPYNNSRNLPSHRRLGSHPSKLSWMASKYCRTSEYKLFLNIRCPRLNGGHEYGNFRLPCQRGIYHYSFNP